MGNDITTEWEMSGKLSQNQYIDIESVRYETNILK